MDCESKEDSVPGSAQFPVWIHCSDVRDGSLAVADSSALGEVEKAALMDSELWAELTSVPLDGVVDFPAAIQSVKGIADSRRFLFAFDFGHHSTKNLFG
jgi:hypothetical protein